MTPDADLVKDMIAREQCPPIKSGPNERYYKAN
jgi:hypothetical protein